jgi:hypothetical protein
MNSKLRKSDRSHGRFCAAISLFVVTSVWSEICLADRSPEAIENKEIKEGAPLDIVGFNYTDRVIDGFSVNGQGGGNIFLSNRTSGGGKSACCVRLPNARGAVSKIHVRWQVDGCVYLTKSRISGETFKNIFSYYKEVDIDVVQPKKYVPQHLELHFYRDGSVRAELTAELSIPRLSLDGKRTDKSNFPRCPDDKKPE